MVFGGANVVRVSNGARGLRAPSSAILLFNARAVSPQGRRPRNELKPRVGL